MLSNDSEYGEEDPITNDTPPHYWGSPWFNRYGRDLGAAERYISKFVKRWSKCYLVSKEKYGSIRYEYLLPKLFGYYHFNIDNWLRYLFGEEKVESEYGSYTIARITYSGSWLYEKHRNLGKFVLKIAVYRAVKKWPHLKNEILEDYYEM